MVCENHLYRPFLTSNDKYNHKHYQQIIFKNFSRWKYMFYWICGIALFIIYLVIHFQNIQDYIKSSHCISFCPTISEVKLNVSAVATGLNVPLVSVGAYYLPPNEPNTARHRPLKEHAYGTKDIFGYPLGAQLISNESEYTIPSDRLSNRKAIREFKYFHEMIRQSHMDRTFGKEEYLRINDAARAAILRGLLAAWSKFTDEKRIPSWIAHGTLLGWWWGGSFLPWDVDIDVQMNANFLYVLERFNRTVVENRYLIDVNPNFRVRQPQKFNHIDARLIDKHTGYYIDITGMADTGLRISSNPQKLLLCDKHVHKTFYSDLHPLVRIEFEGIATWRPYNAENCLIKEYGSKALLQTSYKGYNYDAAQAKWVGGQIWWANPKQVSPGRKSRQNVLLFKRDLTRKYKKGT